MASKHPYPMEELFLKLKHEAGFALGMDEFMAMQKALASGFGVKSLADLRKLCHLLWAKSKSQSTQLDFHFDKLYTNRETESEEALKEIELPAESEVGKQSLELKTRSLTAHFESAMKQESREIKKQQINRGASKSEKLQVLQQQLIPNVQTVKFALKVKYSVLGEREMAQAWRKLRVKERSGAKTELDLEATVHAVAKRGAFFAPELRAALGNVARLHFLVDREGSMVPFHHFSKAILEGAQTIGNITEVTQHYFHDLPKQLFTEALLIDPVPYQSFMHGLDQNKSLVVIISDGGAARASFDQNRISETRKLVNLISNASRNIVWLNPMPSKRWRGSSAGEIAQSVPMFECTPAGLNQAIDTLRGQMITRNTLLQ